MKLKQLLDVEINNSGVIYTLVCSSSGLLNIFTTWQQNEKSTVLQKYAFHIKATCFLSPGMQERGQKGASANPVFHLGEQGGSALFEMQ